MVSIVETTSHPMTDILHIFTRAKAGMRAHIRPDREKEKNCIMLEIVSDCKVISS